MTGRAALDRAYPADLVRQNLADVNRLLLPLAHFLLELLAGVGVQEPSWTPGLSSSPQRAC